MTHQQSRKLFGSDVERFCSDLLILYVISELEIHCVQQTALVEPTRPANSLFEDVVVTNRI